MTTSAQAGKSAGVVVTQIGGTDGALTRAVLTDTSGRLVTTFTDPVSVTGSAVTAALAVSGARVASVTFAFTGASAQQQFSLDGGVNWLNGPYVKRLDVVSANPAVTASISGPGTYEMPIPGNCTNVRLTSATGNVTISGFQPYVPGVPVTAVLYDVTSAVNTANNTGTLDTSGWAALFWFITTPVGGSATVQHVDDAGTGIPLTNLGASSTAAGGLGSGATLGGTTGATAMSAAMVPLLPKRCGITCVAVASLTSRVRVEVRR